MQNMPAIRTKSFLDLAEVQQNQEAGQEKVAGQEKINLQSLADSGAEGIYQLKEH